MAEVRWIETSAEKRDATVDWRCKQLSGHGSIVICDAAERRPGLSARRVR
jgi:hypothetical protein